MNLSQHVIAAALSVFTVGAANASDESGRIVLRLERTLSSAHPTARAQFSIIDGYNIFVESFSKSQECGPPAIRFKLREVGREFYAWQSNFDPSNGRYSSELVRLPAGYYDIEIMRERPREETCDFSILVTTKRVEDLKNEGFDFDLSPSSERKRRRRQITVDLDAATKKLQLAYLTRGRGHMVDVSGISIADFEARRKIDEMNRGLRAPEKKEWLTEVVTAFCDREAADLNNVRADEADRAWNHSAPREERELLFVLLSVAISRHTAMLTGEKTDWDISRGPGAIPPSSAARKMCSDDKTKDAFIAYVAEHQSSITPRFAVHLNLHIHNNLVPLEAVLADQQIFIADALGVSPHNLILDWAQGHCAGYYSFPDSKNGYLASRCLSSAALNTHISKEQLNALIGSSASSPGTFSAAQISANISKKLGTLPIEIVYDVFPMIKLRITGVRGVVVPHGSDWEMIYLTVWQGDQGNGLNLALIGEGFLASGIGRTAPALSAYTRSMDVEQPNSLRDFVGKLLSLLSHP